MNDLTPIHNMKPYARVTSFAALASITATLAGCCMTPSTAKRQADAGFKGGGITIIRGGESSFDRGLPAFAPPEPGPAVRALPDDGPAPVIRNAPAIEPLPLVRVLPAAAPDFASPLSRPPGLTPPAPAVEQPLSDPARLLFGMVPDESTLAGQKIYFDYDSAALATKELAKLRQVAAHLKASPAARLVVDGHCDERGTEEYNRALGERRALSIRSQLLREGVAPDRVYTRSFGKDRPAFTGHGEQSWWQNRRGEFVLLRLRPR